jgi:PAS domain S-box-containing protein
LSNFIRFSVVIFVVISCAEYVKHMVMSTTDKTEAVEKLKNDLEAKKQKFEEDKAVEGRSDPESVTSSLTADTSGSSTRSQSSQAHGCDKKRKAVDHNDGGGPSRSEKKKQHRISSEAASEESSGEGREGGSGTGSGIGKTISTVSDLTDSNRCSSSNNSGSGSGTTDEVPTEQDSGEPGSCGEGGQPSTSSISSDAAVATEKSSREKHSGHKDVVFNNDKRSRKRPPQEVTSLERSFELDYEEVFDKSNIPQLIASTSGKIITWNECFVKATGYRKSEIERMTIFSLVRPDKLSNFFDIVAAALRLDGSETDEKNEAGKTQKPQTTEESQHECDEKRGERTIPVEKETENQNDKDQGTSSDTTEKGEDSHSEGVPPPAALPDRMLDYTAITLPCIDFPAMKKRNHPGADADTIIDSLTVTVSSLLCFAI